MFKNNLCLEDVQLDIWNSNKFNITPDPSFSKSLTFNLKQHTLKDIRNYYRASGLILNIKKSNQYFLCADDFTGLIRCPAGKRYQKQIPLNTALREFEQQVFSNEKADPLQFWEKIQKYILDIEGFLVYDAKMINFMLTVDQGVKQLIGDKKYFCKQMNANFEWKTALDLQKISLEQSSIKRNLQYQKILNQILDIPKITLEKLDEYILLIQMKNLAVEKIEQQKFLKKPETVLISQLKKLCQLHKYKYKSQKQSDKKLVTHLKSMSITGFHGFFVTLSSKQLIKRIFKKMI